MPSRIIVLIILALGLSAAEQRIADLRLVAEARPTAVDFTWDDHQAHRDGGDAFASAGAVGLGGRWGWGQAGQPHLLLLGADLLWVEERGDGLHRRGPLARLEAGYAHVLSDRWTATLMPGLGIGRATMTVSQGAGVELSGPVLELSLRAGLRWQAGERLVLAAEGGWLQGQDDLRGDGASLALDRSGAWAGLSLGWLLDARPRRLE